MGLEQAAGFYPTSGRGGEFGTGEHLRTNSNDFPFPSCKFGTALPFPVRAFVFFGEGTSDSEKWTREGPTAAYKVMTQDLECFLDCCCCLIAQYCLTLCDRMDCRPPASSVHGISQQEYWSGVPFPSPGDQTSISYTAGRFLTTEPPGKPNRKSTWR